MFISMGAARKIQTEIDRTLKKVQEGIDVFDEIWDKVGAVRLHWLALAQLLSRVMVQSPWCQAPVCAVKADSCAVYLAVYVLCLLLVAAFVHNRLA